MVDVASKVFWWFWIFSWIIMFFPSNFRITFGFTNVTWTTRTISFIDNTDLQLFLSFKGNNEFVKFLQKMFWFNFIQFTVGYFNEYERFFNFEQASWNYKTFISTFFTLLKFINNTVNEMQWVISLRKLLFYQRDFFFKVWCYSFWKMKITIDCIPFIACWNFGGPWWR